MEAIIEPLTAANIPQITPQKSVFTAENAAKMQKLSIEARKRKAELAKIAEAKAELIAANSPQTTADIYRAEQLVIVRGQLEKLDKLIAESNDCDEWAKWATAKQKLYDVEARLAGRTNPGTEKPSSKGSRQVRTPITPIL